MEVIPPMLPNFDNIVNAPIKSNWAIQSPHRDTLKFWPCFFLPFQTILILSPKLFCFLLELLARSQSNKTSPMYLLLQSMLEVFYFVIHFVWLDSNFLIKISLSVKRFWADFILSFKVFYSKKQRLDLSPERFFFLLELFAHSQSNKTSPMYLLLQSMLEMFCFVVHFVWLDSNFVLKISLSILKEILSFLYSFVQGFLQ